MKITIFTLAPPGSRSGNRITARRWARIFRSLGHKTEIANQPDPNNDLLIAIHAEKTAKTVLKFEKSLPKKKWAVVVSGTDIYGKPNLSSLAKKSLELANAIVTLEEQAKKRLPKRLQTKTTVIVQSAEPVKRKPAPLKSCFEISVCGHLRKEKDPFLIFEALAEIPDHSRIHVNHIGRALSKAMLKKATRLSELPGRYRWRGEQELWMSRQLVARSRLLVNTSLMESSSNSIVEAIVSGTPVLATRIPGNVGILGEEYPGLFAAGCENELRRLLIRSELDTDYLQSLNSECKRIANRFSFAKEKLSWKRWLRQFSD